VELNLQLKSRIALAVGETESTADAYELWLDVIEEYSMLAITKESDRFPALSGLASFLSQKLRSSYLAGLWEEHLTVGLLWQHCSILYSKCSRAAIADVPAWSWASIVRAHKQVEETNQLQHITYDGVRDGILQDTRFEIIKAGCQLATAAHAFGAVSKRVISIRGALILTKYIFPRHQTRPQLQFGKERNGAHMDIWGGEETPEVNDGDMVFCLLFGRSEYNLAGHALILEAVSASTYFRVGYLNLDESRDWFEDAVLFVIDII
jgi:hypothetical protein